MGLRPDMRAAPSRAPHRRRLVPALLFCLLPAAAMAHVSERALVMLLPTQIYIRTGVAAVALTILFLILVPPRLLRAGFAPRGAWVMPHRRLAAVTSLAALAGFWWLLWAGVTGPRDPLSNALPLFVWSVWWITLPLIQAVFGDVWYYISPWRAVTLWLPNRGAALPNWLATASTLGTYLGFAAFMAVDPAPDDPDRLALIVATYWGLHLIACMWFGPVWLDRGEGLSAFFSQLARLAPVTPRGTALPGHACVSARPLSGTTACLLIIALGAGSFDGLNETFWWLARIGVNPLEFPGRSAVILPNLAGLILFIATLGLTLWLTIRLGAALISTAPGALFRHLIPSLLPIAAGYHLAHYLTSFLVGSQYTALAVTRAIGRPDFYVTTGFFNTRDSIEVIWLTQAGGIVIGHMLAVALSHAIALDLLGSHRKATLALLPLSAFMIAYTFFGLWILAQPTGL